MILIDTDGEIIYDDIGNYQYFSLGMNSAKGKNIRELFSNLEEDYPLLLAAGMGSLPKWELTTREISASKKSEAHIPPMEIKLSARWNLPVSLARTTSERSSSIHGAYLYQRNHTKYILG